MEFWLWFLGIVVAAVSYLSKTLLADPRLEFRAVVGRIDADLIFYSNLITATPADVRDKDKLTEASAALRRHASDLTAAHNRLSWVKNKRRKQVAHATSSLIGLSNITGKGDDVHYLQFMDQVVVDLELWRQHGELMVKGKPSVESSALPSTSTAQVAPRSDGV
ncbi:hypothetical protein ABLG96_13845 [Nakamurella sp. A5-74]|uniref:Uncharacterized protein n=1 Tax=Nakamurella sp. A5-74 TaxID=3158264 RepID=A0AAU8DKR0_9ACTN